MGPDISFNSDGARKLAEDILHRTFHGVKYDAENWFSKSARNWKIV